MRVSLNWLKKYLDLDNISMDELYNLFSLHISEIETVDKLFKANNLVVGEVLEKVAHPDSDHLNVCQVKIGDVSTQIVCGAPNVAVGQKVIVALPGAKLPEITIKPAKVRGIESNGMICSLQELGLDDKFIDEKYKEGIYVLDNDFEAGSDPFSALGFDDYVFDLELTSNRSDLLSIEGVAYDLGAVIKQKPKIVKPLVKEVRMMNPLNVKIETDACYQFDCRYIKNVEIKESPLWLKLRLMASGIRPINNIVDITNLVLIELGQPLHAYDHAVIGNEIIIRNANKDEVFITLDGVERKLDASDIVVANKTEAMCLAGVMGGLTSQVTDKTVDIVLEAAMFSPIKVRKTSSRLGLKSESSIRFERKIDQLRIRRALDYAAMLINELAGGLVVGGLVEEINKPYEVKKVTITVNKINSILGTSLSDVEIEEIFSNLGYEFRKEADNINITLPSRRIDLEPSIQDIVEDVARMLGYDNIPTTIQANQSNGSLNNTQERIRQIKGILANKGFNEVITYSLISNDVLNKFSLDTLEPVKLLMPLTSDREVMRQSLLNGILDVVKYNKDRKISDIAIFEVGKRYGINVEELMLSGAVSGSFSHSKWQNKEQKVDFYLVKGIIEDLFRRLNLNIEFVKHVEQKDVYHPGRSAKIILNDVEIGILASLHPRYTSENDLNETYVFEISLDKVFEISEDFKYLPVPKYPSIERDLAIVVKDDVSAKEVLDVIKMVSKKYLYSINVFDVYKGKGLLEDEKSIAVKMVFLDYSKTLESKDVDKVINSILNRLDFYFKARLR